MPVPNPERATVGDVIVGVDGAGMDTDPATNPVTGDGVANNDDATSLPVHLV